MKPEEAKKYLKNFVGDGSMEFVIGPIRTEVLKKAIDALEKQIPKKPLKIHDVGENGRPYHAYACCNCGDVFDVSYDFCPNCGQAIDWEDYNVK